MNRRNFMKTSSITAAGVAMGSGSSVSSYSQTRKPIIIDGMGELRLEYPMSLITQIIDSGMTAIQVTLGNPALQGPEAYQDALNEIANYERHIEQNRNYFIKATKVEDIHRAQKENKLALMYLFQNTTPIGDDEDRLDFFYNLGVRCVQLTYNTRNLVGEGCSERTQGGLSNFGLQVVERMNKLGILIDLSHGNMPTTEDAIKYSKKPVLITHSCCKGVYDHYRGVTDEIIRILGEKGGVMGICQLNPFVGAQERSTLDDYLKHIDHVVKIAGIDTVGIGSDREHQTIPDTEEERKKLEKEMARVTTAKVIWPFFIAELNHPRRMETIWAGLKKHGYKSTQIEKIMGGNFYRVFKEVMG